MATLETLPDVCLLNVIQFLKLGDICNFRKVSDRINGICNLKSIARHIDIQGSYLLRESEIVDYVENVSHHVEKLCLKHGYWLSARALQRMLTKCSRITHLDIIECRLKVAPLVQLLTRMPNLVSLGFSVQSFSDIKKPVFEDAAQTLAGLRALQICFASRNLTIMTYLGEHTTMLDYCVNVEELRIGAAGMAIPELYRPIISKSASHLKLNVMCITNTIHAGAQMLFYGALSQFPNSQIQWKTLLMPNVNLQEFAKKIEFKDCLQNIQGLKSLDVSGSRVNFPNQAIALSKATDLEYLSLASTMVNGAQLSQIATDCPNLRSLNLHGCYRIMKDQGGEILRDLGGLESCLARCQHLQHLNLAGECYHLPRDKLNRLLPHIRGLKSLALSACMLVEDDSGDGGATRRPLKRIATTRGSGYAPPKRLCTESRIAVPGPSSDPDLDTTSSSESSSSSSDRERIMTVLERIVENNPELETLEIIAPDYTSIIHKNKYIHTKLHKFLPCNESRMLRDLLPICRLRHLRSLTLCGMPGLESGQSISAILKHCERLESVSLSMLGKGLFGNTFTKGLVSCHNLRDLRLEQPHLPLNAFLFGALSELPRLQRLCILARESTFSRDKVLAMVEKCQQLIMLQLHAGGTITANKNLVNTLTKKYVKSEERSGAVFTIYPLMADGMAEVATSGPSTHLEDVSRFYSRVAAFPPDSHMA